MAAFRLRRRLACLLLLVGLCNAQQLSVVDGHVHLANISLIQYAWAGHDAVIGNKSWTKTDYLAATNNTALQPYGPLVFMEADAFPNNSVLEIQWVSEIAKIGQPHIGAIVGSAPLGQGASVRTLLAQLVSEYPLLHGIRTGIPSGADCPGAKPPFLDGVKALAEFNLTFDLLDRPSSGDCTLQLIRAAPQVTFVLDHLGGPTINPAGGNFAQWAPWLDQIAAEPNVVVKISGGPQACDTTGPAFDTWTEEEVAPFVQHTLNAFGYDRSLYAGNWFWINHYGTYRHWAEALSNIVSKRMGASHIQKQALFRDTAARVYRVEMQV